MAALACVVCLGTAYAADWEIVLPEPYSTFEPDDNIFPAGEIGSGTALGLILVNADDELLAESDINQHYAGWDGLFVADSEEPWPDDGHALFIVLGFEFGDPQEQDLVESPIHIDDGT